MRGMVSLRAAPEGHCTHGRQHQVPLPGPWRAVFAADL